MKNCKGKQGGDYVGVKGSRKQGAGREITVLALPLTFSDTILAEVLGAPGDSLPRVEVCAPY